VLQTEPDNEPYGASQAVEADEPKGKLTRVVRVEATPEGISQTWAHVRISVDVCPRQPTRDG